MLLDRQITSLLSLFTRTTRASGSFGKEKQKRAAFINVFLSLVFCFVFCALYSNRHRHYKYKREFVLGKNPRFSVSRYAFCSLVLVYHIGSLSFSAYVYVSKERESDASVVIVLVSSVLESLLLSLFFCRCSFPRKRLVSKDRERALAATWGRRTATGKATTTRSFSPFREEFISRRCSIRGGVQNWPVCVVWLSLILLFSLSFYIKHFG